MAKKNPSRFGFTAKGQQVDLSLSWKVEGGYEGWAVNEKGHAVKVFIPTENDPLEATFADIKRAARKP